MDWQPIESAPKDGTDVLLSDGKRCLVARCYHLDWLSPQDDDELFIRRAGMDRPTHWMPLPEPPLLPPEEHHGPRVMIAADLHTGYHAPPT